jgi:hypothetical protein
MREQFHSVDPLDVFAVPTPSQLRKIAIRALLLANRTETLKRHRRHPKDSRSSLTWVRSHYDPADEDQTDERYGKISCLVTKIPVNKDGESSDTWKMHYSYLEQKMGEKGEWTGELRRYMFEWDKHRTLAAKGNIKDVPSLSKDEIDRMWVLNVKNEIPSHDFLTGQPLDIDALVNAEPTFEVMGRADGLVFSEIMNTLDNYDTQQAA